MEKNVKLYLKEGKIIGLDRIFGFGKKVEGGYLYDPYEALYVIEKGRGVLIKDNKEIKDFSEAIKILNIDLYTYFVFRDLRDRGYYIKVKKERFIDVWVKGSNPLYADPDWLCYVTYEETTMTWQDFLNLLEQAKKEGKRLLLAVVDSENDVTYYEIYEIRP